MLSAAVASLAALTVLAGSIGWIMRDRAALRAKLTGDIRYAVEESQRLLNGGMWPQAQAAAARAEALLGAGAAAPALAERVTGLMRELAEEQADVTLLKSLDAVRLRQADIKDDGFVVKYSRKEYEQSFRTYGLHRNAMAPEVELAHPSVVACFADAFDDKLRAIDPPRGHPQIRATLLLHGSESNKAAGQPAWPDVLTGVSWAAAENTFARHGDTSWCASSPKFRDDLPDFLGHLCSIPDSAFTCEARWCLITGQFAPAGRGMTVSWLTAASSAIR